MDACRRFLKKFREWKVKDGTQSCQHEHANLVRRNSFNQISTLSPDYGKKSCNLALHVLALFSHELISTAYGGRCKFSGVGIKERSAWRFGSP
jgi:hypothetical protein